MVEISNADRARILVHALPYIQAYNGKIVVIKYGGNAMINENLKDSVMRDLVLLTLIGVKVVLVHGGGPEITDMTTLTVGKRNFCLPTFKRCAISFMLRSKIDFATASPSLAARIAKGA